VKRTNYEVSHVQFSPSYYFLSHRSKYSAPLPYPQIDCNVIYCIMRIKILTYSMVQDIIWKADCHSVCQKISCSHYGTRRFITEFTKAHHWTLSWANRIQFAPSMPVSLRSILMFSSHLRLGLPSGLLPSGPLNKCFYWSDWLSSIPFGMKRQSCSYA
jgi:hypothetical protein